MATSLLSTTTIRPTIPGADLSLEDARTAAEVGRVISRLETLASEQERLQAKLATLRDERDRLILRGLAHGMSSSELAARARLTGARVRAIADAAAASSARERVATATRLECLQDEGLVTEVETPDGSAWIVPFDKVCADHVRLSQIVAA